MPFPLSLRQGLIALRYQGPVTRPLKKGAGWLQMSIIVQLPYSGRTLQGHHLRALAGDSTNL